MKKLSMKKLSLMFALIAMLAMAMVVSVQAYTINDKIGDAIGDRTFEGYGINVLNLTPGVNSGSIIFDLYSNYPQTGLVVGGWNTQPADFFFTEYYYGVDYPWGIPLVGHDGLAPGTMYAVGSVFVSDDFEPLPHGGYVYNHNIPVRINQIGNNYGWSAIGNGSVVWNALSPGSPDWVIRITTGVWEDDQNGMFKNDVWGGATCANDVIRSNPVPEPATMLLLGSGLIGLAGFARRKMIKR